jgi:large subunit ribosomal protein LX
MKRIFRVEGRFRQGLWTQRFRKEVVALSERHALEMVLSDIGSRHGVKRTLIKIERVEEIRPEEVKNPRIRLLIEG